MSTTTEPSTTTSSTLEALLDAAHHEAAGAAVARRAYEIFLQHGGHDGHALDHWLQAERELGHLPEE
jgi:Protein of unknown function (DUF2934)